MCLDACEVLFFHGHVFSAVPNGTFTSSILHGLRDKHILPPGFFSDRDAPFKDIGWPEHISFADTARPVLYARELFQLVEACFEVNFPHHSWRTKFGCFNEGENRYAEQVRLDYVEALAVKEGLDPAQTRYQFSMLLPSLKRFYNECQDCKEALIRALEAFRLSETTCRADIGCVLELALSYIGLGDGTGDCERTFAKKIDYARTAADCLLWR